MPDYRLYTLNAEGHILRVPVEFGSASDDEAIEKAQQHRVDAEMELWQGSRLVKAFPSFQKAGRLLHPHADISTRH